MNLNCNIAELLDTKLRKLRFAQMEWDKLWPDLQYEESDYILFFPDKCKEVNNFGMKYIDTFLQRVNGEKAIIVTCRQDIKNKAQIYSENIKKILLINEEQMLRFIDLYELYCFAPHLLIVSIDIPYSRKASNQIGKNHISVEELIAIGVYGIIPFRPIEIGQKII